MNQEELWVQFKPFNPILVPTEGCVYVAHFTKACKREFSPRLDSYGFDQLNLSLTDGGPTLFVGLLLTELSTQPGYSENTAKTPLFISVKSLSITGGSMEISKIVSAKENTLNNDTQKAILEQHSYILDDSLVVLQGQTQSALCYALSKSGRVLVAKIYNENKDDFDREVDADKALDHPNLVKFVTSFSLQVDTGMRHVIIMPCFPRSAADLFLHGNLPQLDTIRVIARGCFDALCHVHLKGLCFADLKPSNVMLHAEKAHATLIDYGATVRIGFKMVEVTKEYCLDAADTALASEYLDWICLGTTLASLGGFLLSNVHTAVELAYLIDQSTKNECLKHVILSCLRNPSQDTIEQSLKDFERDPSQ